MIAGSDRTWPRLGRGLAALGHAAVALVLLVYIGTVLYASRYPERPQVPLWVLLLLLWGALKLHHFGRRLLVPSGPALRARDPRPPILYLRSFRDDAATQAAVDPRSLLPLSPMRLHLRTEEEELAAAFAEVGPMVAVGQPGEPLPRLGAARFYFSDAEWKDQVAALMAASRLVLLRCGRSRGLAWEFIRATHSLPPEKLLLVVGDLDDYRAFCDLAEPQLAAALRALPMQGGQLGSMRGFIAFGPGFAPRWLPVSRSVWRWTLTHPYLSDLRDALQPVFAARGLPFSRPPFPVLKTAVTVALMALSLVLSFTR